MRFDAIVFDFDGVLVESVDVKTRAFAALYEPYGHEVVGQVIAWHLAHGGVSRFDKFRHFHREFLGEELDVAGEQLLGSQFSDLVENAVVASPWVPGAPKFLDAYHEQIPLYVASGTPDDELKRIIDRRNMRRYFRCVFGSPARKGEILRQIIADGGYPPSRVLMVGDAMTDYEGASEAGTAFIGRLCDCANPFPSDIATLTTLEQLAALCA